MPSVAKGRAMHKGPVNKGAAAEDRALAYLEGRGLRPVARNWRVRGGEIDLIMRDGAVLVFVEVRARSSAAYGGAAGSVGALKQARLIHAARAYLAGLGRTPPCRFDVVAEQSGQLTWLRDAFQVSE
jgi:putative endonuclease